MAVAAPNQTRLRILSSILHLESFTVAELCLHAGLEPSMVYRELSELQQQGVLTSAVEKQETAPRHRPAKRYELSDDPETRAKLEEQVGSFLPEFEDAQSNRHLKKAQETLNRLGFEFLTLDLETLDAAHFDRWEKKSKERFREAQKELKRATWESETDFSEEPASDHPVLLASRLYQGLEARFNDQVRRERSRRESEAARKRWAVIFTEALRTAFPAAGTAASSWAHFSWLDDRANLEKVFVLSQQIKKRIDKYCGSHSRQLELFRPFVSSFELDVRGAESKPDILAVLAKHGIAYGASAAEPLALVRGLTAKSDDYRLFFDKANLAQMADLGEEAYQSWTVYLSKKPAPETEDLRQPVVARIRADRWSADGYRKAVQAITIQCKASVAVLSETPFEEHEGHAMALKLYNPVRDKSEPQTELISIADSLVQNKRLYLASTEAEQAVVLGLFLFACAAWFRTRLDDRKAWELAREIAPTERIVKVEFFREADEATRAQAKRILTASLSAELVGESDKQRSKPSDT